MMLAKIEKILLFLLILLLPSQLALHFWPSWSLVHGVRVDYLAPTIYLTDVLILILLILGKSPSLEIRRGVRGEVLKIGILTFILLNILFSFNPLVSIYKYLHLLEYFLLFKYLILKIDWKLKIINWSLSLSVLWTSLLAWVQFIKQGSVGGLMYWLGERTFNITTPGIAKISFFGHLLLRPYATLPHPNALAGFLLVAALILLHKKNKNYLVALATIPITFSHSVILLEILIILFLVLKTKSKIKYFFLPLFLFTIYHLLFTVPLDPQSITERFFLNDLAIAVTQRHPLLGVGLGNFIPATANYLRQPVHNIFLLISSELGLPALLAICYLLLANLKKLLSFKHYLLSITILVMLTTGLVDHYWLTLHQNILLLVILMALTYEHLAPHR